MEQALSGRASSRDLAIDSRLTTVIRGHLPAVREVHDACRVLNLVIQIGHRLTPADILIISAVVSCGNLSAAARMLAPGRPSYRKYISKLFRTKFIPIVEDLLAQGKAR